MDNHCLSMLEKMTTIILHTSTQREKQAPVECLSHSLESLNYIHHGSLLPVSLPCRGKGRALCLLLASLASLAGHPMQTTQGSFFQLRKTIGNYRRERRGLVFVAGYSVFRGKLETWDVIHTHMKALQHERAQRSTGRHCCHMKRHVTGVRLVKNELLVLGRWLR